MSTYHRHIYKEQQSDFSHWETKLQRRDQICVFCKQHDSTQNHPEHDPVFQDNSPRPQTPPKESPGHSLWARQQQGTGRLPSPLNCFEEGGPPSGQRPSLSSARWPYRKLSPPGPRKASKAGARPSLPVPGTHEGHQSRKIDGSPGRKGRFLPRAGKSINNMGEKQGLWVQGQPDLHPCTPPRGWETAVCWPYRTEQ